MTPHDVAAWWRATERWIVAHGNGSTLALIGNWDTVADCLADDWDPDPALCDLTDLLGKGASAAGAGLRFVGGGINDWEVWDASALPGPPAD